MIPSIRLKIANLAAEVIPTLSEVEPLIIPLPNDAPPDFPQVQIENSTSGWAFRFAPARIDFLYTPTPAIGFDDGVKTFEKLVLKVVVEFWMKMQSDFNARCNRLGF